MAGFQADIGFPLVTCLDPRCVPERFFGPELSVGVIRNAGGRANKDAITSITLMRSLADAAAVFVIHHTGKRDFFSLPTSAAWKSRCEACANVRLDCGATHLTDDGVRKDAKARTPDAAEEVDATESYGCYAAANFDETIRIDVEKLRSAKVLAGVDIRGLALDTETGLVRELKV